LLRPDIGGSFYYGIVLFVVIVPSSATSVWTVEFSQLAEVKVVYKMYPAARGTAIDTRVSTFIALEKRK
jgi:hypothetical protein